MQRWSLNIHRDLATKHVQKRWVPRWDKGWESLRRSNDRRYTTRWRCSIVIVCNLATDDVVVKVATEVDSEQITRWHMVTRDRIGGMSSKLMSNKPWLRWISKWFHRMHRFHWNKRYRWNYSFDETWKLFAKGGSLAERLMLNKTKSSGGSGLRWDGGHVASQTVAGWIWERTKWWGLTKNYVECYHRLSEQPVSPYPNAQWVYIRLKRSYRISVESFSTYLDIPMRSSADWDCAIRYHTVGSMPSDIGGNVLTLHRLPDKKVHRL